MSAVLQSSFCQPALAQASPALLTLAREVLGLPLDVVARVPELDALQWEARRVLGSIETVADEEVDRAVTELEQQWLGHKERTTI